MRDQSDNSSLTDVFDVMGAMNHRGSLEIGVAKATHPPVGFHQVNGGVLAVSNRRPSVRAFLADWLRRIETRLYKSEERIPDHSTLDQPALKEALYDALRRRTLTFYALPPMWNFRSWHKEIGTTTKDAPTLRNHKCCAQAVSSESYKRILIDHACKYSITTLPSGRVVADHAGHIISASDMHREVLQKTYDKRAAA